MKPNYNAMVTLLQFTCHYCGKQHTVDPNDPQQAASVAHMLKVQRADGSSFAFCDHECLRTGSRYFGRHPLTAVNEAGNQFEATPTPEVIITDGVRPVAVEEHDFVSLDRLKEIAYEQSGADAEDGEYA